MISQITMPEMTKDEYDALDELWTKNPSEITHKSTTEIIGELVREKIAAEVSA